MTLTYRCRSSKKEARLVFALAVLLLSSIGQAQSNEHQALRVLRSNCENIKNAAILFNVHPRDVASVIFVEHLMNVTWVDRKLDVTFAKYGFNTSIGLGQVKVETAKWIESTLRDSASRYFLGDSLGTIFPATASKPDLISRLSDSAWNACYVAANIAMIDKRWADAGISLSGRVDVLATLYSVGVVQSGVEKRKPHSNPLANQFGRLAEQFYNSDILIDLYPRWGLVQ
ncbi:MAG: hypothetical protein WBD36_03370 [Bacteroidota bacterium]